MLLHQSRVYFCISRVLSVYKWFFKIFGHEHCCGSKSIQGFDDQKLEKIQLKKCLIENSSLLKGHPSYRRGLQLSKENIQHFKKYLYNFFLLLWFVGHFCSRGFGSGLRIRIWIHNTGHEWQWMNQKWKLREPEARSAGGRDVDTAAKL